MDPAVLLPGSPLPGGPRTDDEPAFMLCPTCGFQSPEGFRFCGMCGTRLPAAAAAPCGLCGATAPPDALECPHCRAPLEFALARMLGQERKVITVVFADLVGFTRRASDRDPEEVKDLVDRCFRRLTKCVEEHGGYVDKYVGDGLLALFGVPRAQEDDADRAVRAAAGIQAALAEEAGGPAGTALRMRVGVNTGEAVIGAIAGREDRGITAIGDTVNLASRIQGACQPGSVWVSQSTRDACRSEFTFREIDPIQVKGKSKPIVVFELTGAGGARSSTRRLWNTRFVGRDAEMTRLRRHLDECAGAPRAGIAIVVGEPGIGKSRFLREFRRNLGHATIWWAEIDPYLAGPYTPFLRMVRDRYAGGDGAVSETAWRTVLQGVHAEFGPALSRELESALERVVAPGRAPAEESDATAERRERIRHAFARLFVECARQRTTVLCLDNLHAIDPSSLELLVHLTEFAPAVPLYLLLSSRPEKGERTAWLKDRGALAMTLAPLPEEASRSLVEDVARQSGLADRVRAQIVERSGGNPLFLEELVRAFLQGTAETGTPTSAGVTAEVPRTLYSALAARIDALESREKQVLQTASVIGRVFWADMVAHLAGGDVLPVLARLDEEGLIYAQDVLQFNPGTEYVFRHALVHEVIYGTLLKKTRKDLHRWVAERMVQAYSLDTLELVTLAARHFQAAGEWEEAVKLFARAGDLSMKANAEEEASDYYGRALEMLEPLASAQPPAEGEANGSGNSGPPNAAMATGTAAGEVTLTDSELMSPDDLTENAAGGPGKSFDLEVARARLGARRASVLRRLGRYDEALAALDVVERCASRRSNHDLLADAAAERARILGFQNQFASALDLARRSVQYWQARQDSPRLAQAHFLESELHFLAGRLENVFMALKNAQDLFQKQGDAAGLSKCLFQLGFVLAARGFIDQAYKALEHSLAGIGDRDSARALLAQGKLGILTADRGDLEAATATLRSTVKACAERGLRRAESANRVSLASLLVRQGQTSAAREEIELALALKERIGDRRGRALCHLNLAECWQADGRYGAALAAFASARTEARAASDVSVEAKVRCAEARARWEIADEKRAEAMFVEAMDLSKAAGLRLEEGLSLLGKCRAGAGSMMSSLQLGKAEATAREIGHRTLVAELALLRAEIALARGDAAPAQSQARAALSAAMTSGQPSLELRARLTILRSAPTDDRFREETRQLAGKLRRPLLEMETEGALAEDFERAGNRAEARAARARGEALAARIAAACDDPALAKAFLASERVRRIVRGA